jgi:CheY-like chemotaxis protein
VLRQTLDVVRGDISEKQIDLKLHLRAHNDRVMVDSVRLQQVFWNVIKNAVKFTPVGGYVSIQTHNSTEGKVTIEISDSGPGIETENVERIFEAFAQAGQAKIMHRFGGLGLGLSISRRLIEIQNGHIWAEPQSECGGAKFIIELPLALNQEKATAPTVRPNGLETHGGGLKILLLEDHEPTRLTMLRLLERRGHQVGCAASLAEARDLAARERWQLLISDLGLTDGSGYTFMEEMRASQGIPGLALSGYGTESDIAKSLEAGFAQHLVKPLNIQELEQAIAAVQGRELIKPL